MELEKNRALALFFTFTGGVFMSLKEIFDKVDKALNSIGGQLETIVNDSNKVAETLNKGIDSIEKTVDKAVGVEPQEIPEYTGSNTIEYHDVINSGIATREGSTAENSMTENSTAENTEEENTTEEKHFVNLNKEI